MELYQVETAVYKENIPIFEIDEFPNVLQQHCIHQAQKNRMVVARDKLYRNFKKPLRNLLLWVLN